MGTIWLEGQIIYPEKWVCKNFLKYTVKPFIDGKLIFLEIVSWNTQSDHIGTNSLRSQPPEVGDVNTHDLRTHQWPLCRWLLLFPHHTLKPFFNSTTPFSSNSNVGRFTYNSRDSKRPEHQPCVMTFVDLFSIFSFLYLPHLLVLSWFNFQLCPAQNPCYHFTASAPTTHSSLVSYFWSEKIRPPCRFPAISSRTMSVSTLSTSYCSSLFEAFWQFSPSSNLI